MFYGRASELTEISNFLRGNQSVSIVGPHEIGKTSLMMHLMQTESKASLGIGNEHLFAFIDCHALSGCLQSELITFLCKAVANVLHTSDLEAEPALKDVISNPTWFTFEVALHKLNLRGLKIVLILDDFEQLTQNLQLDLHFYNALRSLAGRFQLAYLTCSTQPLVAITNFNDSKTVLSSPFFNIFTQINLGLLSEAEAREMIRKRKEAAGVIVSSQLEDFIYQLVGGHPLALQVACSQAWDNPQDLRRIEAQTRQELEPHFHNYWRNLSQAERDFLQHPFETRMRADSDPSRRIVLRDLTRKCLLVQIDGSYRYPSKAWADFVGSQKNEQLLLSSPGSVEHGN